MLFLVPSSLLMAAGSEKYEGIEITVNVNQASAEELATLLSGIGMKKAQAIVDYRNEFGDFTHLDELTKVKGIGESILDKNRTRIEL
ncbi:ComEA family DNA-binding protein [Vibrio amylolyticus]